MKSNVPFRPVSHFVISLHQLIKFSNILSCSAGPEYGTTEAAWKAVLVEADRRGALHNRVKEDLNTKVVADIKQWQKDSFHKVNECILALDALWSVGETS